MKDVFTRGRRPGQKAIADGLRDVDLECGAIRCLTPEHHTVDNRLRKLEHAVVRAIHDFLVEHRVDATGSHVRVIDTLVNGCLVELMDRHDAVTARLEGYAALLQCQNMDKKECRSSGP